MTDRVLASHTLEVNARRAQTLRRRWAESPEGRKRASELSKAWWFRPGNRDKRVHALTVAARRKATRRAHADLARARWADPAWKARTAQKIAKGVRRYWVRRRAQERLR